METEYDVIIIGGGPAGLSGALILGRCDRRVLVLDDGRPRNACSFAMHGYLTRDHTSPGDFLRCGRDELKRYPSVHLRSAEVADLGWSDPQFWVQLRNGEVLQGKKVLLATGLVDELPAIPGLVERWGTSVFPCPFCDAWEFRGLPMAVWGNDVSAATSFALEMLTWTKELTLLLETAGEPSSLDSSRLMNLGIRVEQRKVAGLEGQPHLLEYVRLADDEMLPCRALFVLTQQHQRNGFAEKLGCAPLPVDNTVPTDDLQHTLRRGVYAAGNASTGLQSAILAAAEGFKAAYAINDELIEDHLASRQTSWSRSKLVPKPRA